jgi:hypothetical protein
MMAAALTPPALAFHGVLAFVPIDTPNRAR